MAPDLPAGKSFFRELCFANPPSMQCCRIRLYNAVSVGAKKMHIVPNPCLFRLFIIQKGAVGLSVCIDFGLRFRAVMLMTCRYNFECIKRDRIRVVLLLSEKLP